jgi:hypothetical protein
MEIFLIKSSYHNEYHVENLASIFLIFTPTCGQVEILVAIWLHDASKKIAGKESLLGVSFGAGCMQGPGIAGVYKPRAGRCKLVRGK